SFRPSTGDFVSARSRAPPAIFRRRRRWIRSAASSTALAFWRRRRDTDCTVLGSSTAVLLGATSLCHALESPNHRNSDPGLLRYLGAGVGRDGWRLVCLLGASPLTPFVAIGLCPPSACAITCWEPWPRCRRCSACIARGFGPGRSSGVDGGGSAVSTGFAGWG